MGAARPDSGALPALPVLGGAFLLGGVAGCLLAGAVDGDGVRALSAYVGNYLSAARAGEAVRPGLTALLWEQLRWPLCAVLLGLSPVGLPGLPILFAARGFFLVFSIGSFVRMFGAVGGLWALALFGLSALLTVPVVFVLGGEGWARLTGGTVAGNRLLRYTACAVALCICILVELFLAPTVLATIAGLLTVP